MRRKKKVQILVDMVLLEKAMSIIAFHGNFVLIALFSNDMLLLKGDRFFLLYCISGLHLFYDNISCVSFYVMISNDA